MGSAIEKKNSMKLKEEKEVEIVGEDMPERLLILSN